MSIPILFAFLVIFRIKYSFSCEDWDLGLNNTRIDNNPLIYPCEFYKVQGYKCSISAFDNVFDLSRIYNPVCKATPKERKLFLLGIPNEKRAEFKKYKKFLFPLTNINETLYNHSGIENAKEMSKIVNSNLIPIPFINGKYIYPKFKENEKPEVELTFNKKNIGEISIKLVKKNDLIIERRKKAKESKSLYKNVLVVYTDAVSRAHYKRKLKKISKFIEQFMHYEPEESKKKFTTFQFLKFNALKSFTVPNVKPMFFGAYDSDKKGTNVVKFFKSQGYITGHSESTCGREIFEIYPKEKPTVYKYLDYDSFDHENIAMFCDNNFHNVEGGHRIFNGFLSNVQRCLYGKGTYEHSLEYLKQFWRTYKDEKKYFRIHMNEGHEGTLEVVKYIDSAVAETLQELYNENLFEDTAIFFVSDHGDQCFGPISVFNFPDYHKEMLMPAFFLMIPNKKEIYDNGVYNNLYENQQNLMGPYDIHDTLVHVAFGNTENAQKYNSKYGKSLFLFYTKSTRICNLTIYREYCVCQNYKKK